MDPLFYNIGEGPVGSFFFTGFFALEEWRDQPGGGAQLLSRLEPAGAVGGCAFN